MEALQRALLGAFLLLAALTAFQQLRYGMLCGRAEGEDKQSDPRVLACRRRAVLFAVGAGACLLADIAVGAIARFA